MFLSDENLQGRNISKRKYASTKDLETSQVLELRFGAVDMTIEFALPKYTFLPKYYCVFT